MVRFEKHPDRLGISFWLPVMLVNGAVVIALLGVAAAVEGTPWVQRRFHTSFVGLAMVLAVTSVSVGLVAGFLNPYVSNRLQASVAGMIAALPGSIAVAVVTGTFARGWLYSSMVAILVAGFVGGLYGALSYRR